MRHLLILLPLSLEPVIAGKFIPITISRNSITSSEQTIIPFSGAVSGGHVPIETDKNTQLFIKHTKSIVRCDLYSKQNVHIQTANK